jgi:hypothetical protein
LRNTKLRSENDRYRLSSTCVATRYTSLYHEPGLVQYAGCRYNALCHRLSRYRLRNQVIVTSGVDHVLPSGRDSNCILLVLAYGYVFQRNSKREQHMMRHTPTLSPLLANTTVHVHYDALLLLITLTPRRWISAERSCVDPSRTDGLRDSGYLTRPHWLPHTWRSSLPPLALTSQLVIPSHDLRLDNSHRPFRSGGIP